MSARDLPLTDLLSIAAGLPALSVSRVDPRANVDCSVQMGHGCQVRSGAVLPRGTRLGDAIVVGHNAVFIDAEAGERPAVVEDGVTIGANAVVYAGVVVGAQARVRPGAVVTRSVPAGAIVEGNPAVVVGHLDAPATLLDTPH